MKLIFLILKGLSLQQATLFCHIPKNSTAENSYITHSNLTISLVAFSQVLHRKVWENSRLKTFPKVMYTTETEGTETDLNL